MCSIVDVDPSYSGKEMVTGLCFQDRISLALNMHAFVSQEQHYGARQCAVV